MKFSKKILATIALSASLFGGASATNAAIHYVGGGTWDQGVNYGVMNTWSNYHRPSKAHGSTACSAKGCNSATPPTTGPGPAFLQPGAGTQATGITRTFY
ncbi:lactococcin 972 family bacteriocin [Rothia nasisuis]|uniref:lactococcin 972 family bacteriocin n=1 Tax=Rothia nasisuis TaxID=2109647 RepID=UPI0034DFA8A2